MSNNKPNYINYLEDLKERYFRGEVSALIGAGFSKNIYPEFPNWDELLYDMIIDLFEHQIQNELIKYNHLNKKKTSRNIFYKEEAERITKRIGYLNIVSMYQEKHGYRECIENYIETRIPHLEEGPNKNLFVKDKKRNKSIPLEESAFEIHKSLLNLTSLNHIYTTNYDNLLEKTSDKFNGKWKATTTSQDLRLSQGSKAIIKLHGNLRTNEHEPFCFDNDHGKCYVISKEDYDTYPEKHEPFMQLMKISLLRETFILFGFSGTDPNFIAWVKWVRNILVKKQEKPDNSLPSTRYRVFLFAIDENLPTPAQHQFYENHNIAYIPILNSSYIKFLNIERSNNIVKKVLLETIDYFNNGKTTYEYLWGKSFSITPKLDNGSITEEFILNPDVIDSLLKMSKNNRFVTQINKQTQLLQNHTKTWNLEIKKLAIKALQDTKYPPTYYKIDQTFFENGSEQQRSFDLIQQRFNILKSKNFNKTEINYNQCDEAIYNELLQYVFSFDFKTLKERLDLWSPKDHWIQNKAMLVAIFDTASATRILLKFLETCTIPQERCYCTNLLLVLNIFDKKFQTKEFEQEGISDLVELSRLILKGITKEKGDKIKPYGLIKKTISLGSDNTKYLESIRLLQFLIDSGLPVYYQCLSCINSDEWFIVAKELFETFPYPILYYSLQITNIDFQIRMGQEYAYSENLNKEEKNRILSTLLKYYLDKDAPKYWNDLIISFSQSLLTVVSPNIWEDYFKNIYLQNIQLDNFANLVILTRQFFYNGVSLMADDSNKISLLKETLKAYTNQISNNEAKKPILELATILCKKIQNTNILQPFIDKLFETFISEYDFIAIANLVNLFNETHLEATLEIFFKANKSVQDQITEKDIQALSFFTHKVNNEKWAAKLKYIILDSSYVWGKDNYIPINHIGQFINWNNQDIISIYKLLEIKYSQYITHTEEDPILSLLKLNPIINPISDALIFLSKYKSLLITEEMYDCMYTQLFNKLSELMGSESKALRFLSADSHIVNDSIVELIRTYKHLGSDAVKKGFNTIINNILYKKQEGLNSCLHAASWILGEDRSLITPEITDKLTYILEQYQGNMCIELNLDPYKAYRDLYMLAEVIKDDKPELYTYWKEKKNFFYYPEE